MCTACLSMYSSVCLPVCPTARLCVYLSPYWTFPPAMNKLCLTCCRKFLWQLILTNTQVYTRQYHCISSQDFLSECIRSWQTVTYQMNFVIISNLHTLTKRCVAIGKLIRSIWYLCGLATLSQNDTWRHRQAKRKCQMAAPRPRLQQDLMTRRHTTRCCTL